MVDFFEVIANNANMREIMRMLKTVVNNGE